MSLALAGTARVQQLQSPASVGQAVRWPGAEIAVYGAYMGALLVTVLILPASQDFRLRPKSMSLAILLRKAA